VPYSHSVRLHQALTKAGVTNQHVTIPGGRHGNFTDAEMIKAFAEIRSFLDKNVLKKSPGTN
jgi:dipeptidyl aminopeptidase/acylaminoacyl peptidase